MERKNMKKVLVATMLVVLMASVGGCFYPYRPYYDYDYHHRDHRYYDHRDYDHRAYYHRDYDHDRW